VKLEVEDLDEADFADKWPFILDHQAPEEPEREFKMPTQEPSA